MIKTFQPATEIQSVAGSFMEYTISAGRIVMIGLGSVALGVLSFIPQPLGSMEGAPSLDSFIDATDSDESFWLQERRVA